MAKWSAKTTMLTIQISLRVPKDLIRRLDERARRQRIPRSELIRTILEATISGSGVVASERPYTRVKALLGALSGGPRDLGRRHREHLRDMGHAR